MTEVKQEMRRMNGLPYVGGTTNSKRWKELRNQILERSAESSHFPQCECCGECGINHQKEFGDLLGRCCSYDRQPNPVTGNLVILQVCHLDHDTTNNHETNLMAMCQRCHNNFDAENRTITRKLNAKEDARLIKRNALIKDMRDSGATFKKIQERFGLSHATVWNIANEVTSNDRKSKAVGKGLCNECYKRKPNRGLSCEKCRETNARKKAASRTRLSEIVLTNGGS